MNEGVYATTWRQAMWVPSGAASRSRFFLRNAALSALSLANRLPSSNFLRCLYCHSVFDDQREKFDRLLEGLLQYGTFVTTDACVQMLRGERPIDGRYYHLSIDDGFRNNFTTAFPILRKHRIPCIFFVPSSLIEANWETTKQYCLVTTKYRGVMEMLNWDDLREMIAAGYEIGSHTKTHTRFCDISSDGELMDEEIAGSKLELEERLGVQCKYISWPYGHSVDVNTESLDVARGAGYLACFGAFRGSIEPAVTDIFRIPRHHFEVHWPLSHVKYFARGKMELA